MKRVYLSEGFSFYAFFTPLRASKFERKGHSELRLLSVLLVLVLAFPGSAANSHGRRPSEPGVADPSYVLALLTANRFLYAWQMGDLETGMVLLSDHVRHSQNPERLEQFFSAALSRSYEITRGKGNRGRYSFPVVLLTAQGRQIHRRFSEIIVVNTGKNDWAVDKLP